MADNISFHTAVQICDVLGSFAQARSGSKPNKDIIMMVQKVDGRETLKLTQLSRLTWLQRFVRWFGFGFAGTNATLKGVNRYLSTHFPYLPRRFSDLQSSTMPQILEGHYFKDAIPEILSLKKARLKQLREERFQGIEIFKKCLANHNAKSRCKVYYADATSDSIKLTKDNDAMGVLRPQDASKIAKKYQGPILQPREFGYLDPEKVDKHWPQDSNAKGVCSEYGLGVKKDRWRAEIYYLDAALGRYNFAASYNAGRILMEKGDYNRSGNHLAEAEGLLQGKLDEGNRRLQQWAQRRLMPVQTPNGPMPPTPDLLQRAEEYESAIRAGMKADRKAIRRVLEAQVELYQRKADPVKVAEARSKLINLI